MKAGKIILPIFIVIAATLYFSIFIVKELIKQLFYNLVIQKDYIKTWTKL